jgi:hypothetical protein
MLRMKQVIITYIGLGLPKLDPRGEIQGLCADSRLTGRKTA